MTGTFNSSLGTIIYLSESTGVFVITLILEDGREFYGEFEL